MCTGVLLTGLGIIGFSSVASGKPKFLLLVSDEENLCIFLLLRPVNRLMGIIDEYKSWA